MISRAPYRKSEDKFNINNNISQTSSITLNKMPSREGSIRKKNLDSNLPVKALLKIEDDSTDNYYKIKNDASRKSMVEKNVSLKNYHQASSFISSSRIEN